MSWVQGLHDTVLWKVQQWNALWPQGKPAADREWVNPASASVEKLITKRYVEMPWTPKEFGALLVLLKREKEFFLEKGAYEFVLHLEEFYHGAFARCRLLPVRHPGERGLRLVGLVTYKEDTEDVLAALLRVRDRKKIEHAAAETAGDDFWSEI